MLPKTQATLQFLAGGINRTAIITSLEKNCRRYQRHCWYYYQKLIECKYSNTARPQGSVFV